MSTMIMLMMEVIGTVAFAISGALIAISCSLDIFGVTFIGCVTAFGGGILRDLLIGNTPPGIFSNINMLMIAAASSWLVFLLSYFNAEHFKSTREKVERVNNVFDAIGLSAFSVIGTEIACAAGFQEKALLCILMGMLTGVGGGIFRDVLVDKTPYVLKKHVYALASIIGSSLYYLLSFYAKNTVVATIVAILTVFLIRMLATKYHWKLPKIKIEE